MTLLDQNTLINTSDKEIKNSVINSINAYRDLMFQSVTDKEKLKTN
jgi:hypothetical protein